MSNKNEMQAKITELEVALREEQQETEAILNATASLIIALNGQGRIVKFNQACEKVTGYTFTELKGELVWDWLILQEEKEGVQGVFDQLNAGMFPNQYENYWRTKDNGRVLIVWSNTAIVDENGDVQYIVGTGVDVTEQKRLKKLYQLSRTLTSVTSELEILQVVAQPALEAGAFNAGLSYIEVDDQGQPIWSEMVATWPEGSGGNIGDRYPLVDFPLAKLWFAEANKPLYIEDVLNDPRVDEASKQVLTQQFYLQATIVMPLAQAEQWKGIIFLNWMEPHTFSEADKQVFDVLPALVAPVVANRWLVRNLEKMVTERTAELKEILVEQKEAEAERVQLQQEVVEAQQRVIQELSVPIIPIMERIIVLPLVGSIDSMRAKDLMRTLLAGITQYRAKIVILDITGVSIVDTGVANHLDKTIQAARLKGARTILTGISDAVAETVIDLGIDWSNIETLRDLQTGLMVALQQLGLTMSKK
ncbi:PAS domain S-box protein [Anaerolineales bacterium HSG24]|nr:PAS domain S-box protein [Anaerolineales bacterium HSG24]